ncbi:hypothetical protein EVAR_36507_1 [Eumeta japonica]|uniref:XK-related protein n=1 Tax=Eumeta variegata TaxID=151549 RepID=A0A4C1XA05_EUMVA|nr:hypothetical protein EVAR_36507_1 [Eumeta japonica]
MVRCELDAEVSGEVLGWPLPAWQALLLHRALPACFGLLMYLTLICFDLALLVEHFQNNDKMLGFFCIILFTTPPLVTLAITLGSPPPTLQTDLSGFSIIIQKKDVYWILKQILYCLIFPIATIGRYCHQIFWWIEVVCAARTEDKERIKEALLEAKSPSSLELYLFLHAFLHAAPHAVVNILDLMSHTEHPSFDKVSMQAVSIVASSMRMASTAALYRRFEREKLCGCRYPWNSNYKSELENTTNEKLEEMNIKNAQTETMNTTQEQNQQSDVSHVLHRASVKLNRNTVVDNMDNKSPKTFQKSYSFIDNLTPLCSDSSSIYSMPESLEENYQKKADLDSDDEYVRPISIIDRVAPRRRDTQYTIEKVNITPPPAMPAPGPGSLSMWADKLVENAESIPLWLSAPPRRKYNEEVVEDEPDIPRRVPRNYQRGLEPQDATALLVHYLGWYAFFVSRLLSIAAFINFYPVAAAVYFLARYHVMLLLLIVPQASTMRRVFYIFLAFVYFFCLLEFKIRFRHVRVWHVFWLILCTIETVVFTGVWATTNTTLNSWWRQYVNAESVPAQYNTTAGAVARRYSTGNVNWLKKRAFLLYADDLQLYNFPVILIM